MNRHFPFLATAVLCLVLAALLAVLWAVPLQAQTTCTATGGTIRNWDSPTHWSCGAVPTSADDVIIPNDVTMRVNTNGAQAGTITVQNGGVLQMGSNNNARDLTVTTDITVDGGGTFQPFTGGSAAQSHQVNIGGDLINNGTFNGRQTGAANNVFNVTFAGTGAVISGTSQVTFNDLTVAEGATLALPAGTVQPTVDSTLTLSGTLAQTQPVNNANIAFLEIQDSAAAIIFRGVEISTTGSMANLGDVTVSVEGVDDSAGEYCTTSGAGSPTYADRCYDITPTTSGTALIRLWTLTTETNGIAEANLRVYRFVTGSGWVELTTAQGNGNDGGSYSYAEGETSTFSPFLMGGTNSPTAVSLQSFHSPTVATLPLFLGGLLLGLLFLSAGLIIRQRHHD